MPFLSKVAADALTAQQQADAEAKAAADAAAAAEAAKHDHDTLVAAARGRLTAILGHDADADVLTEAAVDTAERLVVLTDGVVDLAVTPAGDDDATVWLVRNDNGWTRIAQLTCLADLGAALATTTGGEPA